MNIDLNKEWTEKEFLKYVAMQPRQPVPPVSMPKDQKMREKLIAEGKIVEKEVFHAGKNITHYSIGKKGLDIINPQYKRIFSSFKNKLEDKILDILVNAVITLIIIFVLKALDVLN